MLGNAEGFVNRFDWYNAIYLLTMVLQLATSDDTRTDPDQGDADARMGDLRRSRFADLGRTDQLPYPAQANALFDLVARLVAKRDIDVLEKIKEVVRQLQGFSNQAESYTV